MSRKHREAAGGRPVGAKTGTPTTTVPASRCPRCGSTEREDYAGVVEREIGGKLLDGTLYTHIVWRRTRCTECGQRRVDKTHENRPQGQEER